MTRKLTAAFGLLAGLTALLPANASGQDWRMDPERSQLGFIGSAQGESFEGRFDRFSPEIRFDPANLAGARFDVRIDLASVDTDNAERDETILGGDFFAVRKHPEARYLADSFRDLGQGRYAADGTLTLHGITRPVTLVFTWQTGAPVVLEGEALLEGDTELDRLAFELGTGDWADPDTIAHQVKVITRLVLLPAG